MNRKQHYKQTAKEVFERIKILAVILIVFYAVVSIVPSPEPKPEVVEIDNTDNPTDDTGMSIDEMIAIIIEKEKTQPPRIGMSPTEEEIYSSPYIKHIRTAFNGYLDDTNSGVEITALRRTTDERGKCGLDNFSKDYYQSKFIIINAYDNFMGGVFAYIIFVDKPDTIFEVWIYQLGSWYNDDGEYIIRSFCGTFTEEEAGVGSITDYIDKWIERVELYL